MNNGHRSPTPDSDTLPEGWREASLSSVADIRVSNVDKKSIQGEIPVRLCNYNDVYGNEYITGTLDFMEATASASEIARFGVEVGDVVITKDSETPDEIGVPAVALWSDPRLVCGYHLALLKPDKNEVNPVFLAKQLCVPRIVAYFGRLACGSTRYGLSNSGIANTPLWLPPLLHQSKIARNLTTLDNLIEKSGTLIAKYQAIKKGLMHDLFTRGVDAHGHLRPPKAEAPELYKQSALGWIPKDWWVATIGELFDKRTEHGREGLPVMSIVMRDGLVERSSVDRRVESNLPPQGHALVLKGDIAYNMMRMWQGVLGRASFDCLVSPAYVVLKPKDTINTRFAAFLFSDERSIQKFRQFSQGVVDDRLRLYFHDLVYIPFAVPTSLDEQEEIANRIEACNKRIATEKTALDQYQSLRLGLMQVLLTGKVRVKVDDAEEDRQ
jgi:type I restriction enzyme, S subunit